MIKQFLMLALICAGVGSVVSAQMSGTYTVNNAGGANFTSLGAAFTALETQGVNGAVIIEIYDDGGTYTATNEYALGTGNGTTTAAAVSGLSATNTLTIRAASGEKPVFSGSSAVSKFGTGYTGTIAFANTSYTTVEGLTVTGGTSFGIHLYSDTTTTSFAVRRCTVYNCGVGIYLYGNGGTVNNSFVENNFVYSCPVTGSFASFSQGAIGFRRPSSVTLQHNTVVRNSGSAYGAFGWSGGTSYKPTFRYNIGIAQVSGSKCISNDTTGMLPTVCDYNCWYFTGGATFHSNTAYSTFNAWQTAGFDANGMNTNPLLTSTSTSGTDLHLQSSSPCIDAATTSSFNIDIDGDSRPNGSGRDIGGDEFVPAGPTITPNTNTLALGTTTQGTAGGTASYKVTGTLLTGNTTITAPTDVQIKLSTDTTWGSTIVVPPGSGNWGPLTIDARISPSASVGSITGNITHVSTGATTKNVAVNGTVTGPTILTSTGSLNLGSTYLTYAGTPVSYTVSGSILSGQTVITAPGGVQVSFSQTSGFAQSITEVQTGTWGPTTVWARIAPSAAQGAISGNITHVSSGATTVNVSVTGTMNAPTVVPSTSAITVGQTVIGTAGTEASYTVTGTGTSTVTTVTAPTGVEVSLSQTTGYATSITIPTTGTWGPTTVWARISASAPAGAINANITQDTTGAATGTVNATGNVIDLQANPTTLNLGATPLGTPGSEFSYVLTGDGMVGNTVVTAPAGCEISETSGGTFTPSVTITTTPSFSVTIYVRLTGAALGAVSGDITNTNSGVTVLVGITGSVNPPNDLTVTRNGPSSSTGVDNDEQGAGGDGLVILDFSLTADQAAWTVSNITFSESGTADGQNDISFLALYEDSTTSGTQGSFDGPATDTLATAASVAGFNGANGDYTAALNNTSMPVTTTRRFFLVVKLAGTASSGETIQAEITAMTATSTGGGSVTGLPTTGANAALDINAATLTATLNGPTAFTTVNNTSQGPGGNGHVIADVSLAAQNDSWTVTSLTFTASGSADEQADMNFLALYVDNGNGTFDGPGTDTLATATSGTSFNAPNGTYTAALTAGAGAFGMNGSKRFFLVAKLNGGATSGENFRAALTAIAESSPSSGSVVGIPTAATSALVIDVATLTVNAGPNNPADAFIEATGTAFTHTLGELRLSASNSAFTLSGITLTVGGNGDWVNNVTSVAVFLDDGDGTYGVTDTSLFSGTGSAGSITCNFSSNVTVNDGASQDLWVLVGIATTAGGSPAETFSTSIASTADVAVVTAGGQVMIGTVAPVSSTLSMINYSFTSFTPTSDNNTGGKPITITGTGFALPVIVTIGGVTCTGTASVDATGTQITGLFVPGGSGTNLPITLDTNNLGPKTLSQTFTYQFTLGGTVSGGGGGGGGGCTATSHQNMALLLALVSLFACAVVLRRRSA